MYTKPDATHLNDFCFNVFFGQVLADGLQRSFCSCYHSAGAGTDINYRLVNGVAPEPVDVFFGSRIAARMRIEQQMPGQFF